jgi:SNF2 family DNA or RNA helicase
MREKRQLKPHQLKAVDWLVRKPMSGLFLDMGLGKTASVLTAFEELRRANRSGALLVIAPLRVAETVWDSECRQWEHVAKLRVVKVLGSARHRAQALTKRADIYTINVDNCAWLATTLYAMQQQGRKIPFDWMVIDESSMFKARDTRRFKAVRALLPAFKRRTILTGTPTPNSLVELWPQIYILDQGERLGFNPDTYTTRYFERNMDGRLSLKENAHDRIAEKVGDIVLRMDGSGLVGMPEKVANEVVFNLPPAARKVYDKLEAEMFVMLNAIFEEQRSTGIVRAVNMAVLVGKCHQLANGAVFDSENRALWHEVHKARLDVLEEVLGEIGGNALVAYTYRHDRERILKRFGNVPFIGGGNKDTMRVIDEWNAGKHPIVLVHPKSASHGLNMQFGGHNIVWFSNLFSLELHDQLIARLARPGQRHPFVTTHYLIADNTTDLAMRAAIETKAAGQEAHLHALKAYQERRSL